MHVAVGVVRDGDGNILLTQRAKHAHQGGLWEFPGGKLEADESVLQALQRELFEEVGIGVQSARPLIKINHRYPDLHVLLDVWQINEFTGAAQACEGQAMRWVSPRDLNQFSFPAANAAIVTAARLPDRYAILEGASPEAVLQNLECILRTPVTLLQVRIKSLPLDYCEEVCRHIAVRIRGLDITLLINSDLPVAQTEANGLHLSSRDLLSRQTRPPHQWVAASCHNLQELQHAERIGVDFAVLAPILCTQTHPDAVPLGWEALAELTAATNLPVFALGGLGLEDLERVTAAGCQGIAGISAFLR